jgi:uncharacterized membrane protein
LNNNHLPLGDGFFDVTTGEYCVYNKEEEVQSMKTISKRQYDFLEETLNEQVANQTMTEAVKDRVLQSVEVRDSLNFIRVLVSIGGILIGLGFLTFIATNWNLFDRWVKFFIIVGSLSVALGSSYVTFQKNRFTSIALLYLSALIYGAGIFLVEQIFYINLDIPTGFLIWSVGTLLLSTIHKDIILFVGAHILAAIYILGSFDNFIFLQAILLLGLLLVTNRYFGYRRLLTFAGLLLIEAFIIYTFAYVESDALYVVLVLFGIGTGLYYVAPVIPRLDVSPDMVSLVGLLTLSISGFILTFPGIYTNAGITTAWISWVFAIALLLYLLFLTSRRLVTPLLAIAAIIIRYYFDTFYESIDRSLFFVLGGLMILAFGYYIETMRRRGFVDAKLDQ